MSEPRAKPLPGMTAALLLARLTFKRLLHDLETPTSLSSHVTDPHRSTIGANRRGAPDGDERANPHGSGESDDLLIRIAQQHVAPFHLLASLRGRRTLTRSSMSCSGGRLQAELALVHRGWATLRYTPTTERPRVPRDS